MMRSKTKSWVIVAMHFNHIIITICACLLSISLIVASDAVPAKVLGQYAGLPLSKDTQRLDIQALLRMLNSTYTQTYSFLLWDTTGNNYLDLVLLLRYIVHHDTRLQLGITLIPPSESMENNNTKCSIFVDSPLTEFNETSFLNLSAPSDPHGCLDYLGHAKIINHLAKAYPGLISFVNVDDFSVNLDTFTETYSKTFKGILQTCTSFPASRITTAGCLDKFKFPKFIPTYYYGHHGILQLNQSKYHYLTSVLDGITFYFRNDKYGQQTCLPCKFTSSDVNCTHPCLYEHCSESSIPNFQSEAADIASVLKTDSFLFFVGIYFTAYSHCGPTGPSLLYDQSILEQSLLHHRVNGVIVYTLKYPSAEDLRLGCVESRVGEKSNTSFRSKGCIVREVFKQYVTSRAEIDKFHSTMDMANNGSA